MEPVSYAEAREKLSAVLDQVVSTRDPVLIKRRGRPDVALLPADELSSLMETARLLVSPANARRLLGALKRVRSGRKPAMTIVELRKKSGLDEARR